MHKNHTLKDKSMRAGPPSTQQVMKDFIAFGIAVLLGLSAYSSAWANPIDGQVTAGDATIFQSLDGATVQVNQASDKAIIDWHSFNIDPNELTAFQQPSRSAIVLNRANPANGASSILGRLTANGNVWIVNPAGVIFGASARVDVGGLLATTGWISKEDFMNGNYHFKQLPGWHGAVINRGTITIADKGLLLLVAPGVENSGTIQVNLGQVILASGNEFTVDFYGDQLINFSIDAKSDNVPVDENGKPLKAAVSNSGSIIAHNVLMTAQTAEGVVDQAINMSGYVEANTAVQKGGEIVLMGGDHGAVNVSGVMVAAGKQAGQKGGKVKILAKKVDVVGNAVIDVSGAAGGGEVLIGGDFQGKNPNILNAEQTFFASSALVDASAGILGNGGKVIVWANDIANFYGTILVKGGAQGGDGGFVETSGKNYLDVNGGFVDARAPLGTTGTWLLDPINIYIALNQANATAAGMSGTNTSANTGSGGNPNTFAGSGVILDSLLTTGNLNTALGSANVIVTTTNTSGTGLGNITVVDPISWSSTNSLTLIAANNIALNAGITTGAAGSRLILDAAGSVTQTGVISGSGGLTQQGAGTATLTQANTYSGSTLVNGAITLSGNGTAANTVFTVNQGGILTLDNSATNNTNRISDSNILTLNGGEFVFKGSASTNASETVGALTLPTGYSTITVVSGAGGSTGLTFASANRSAGALVLLRGTNLGATAGAGNTNINFTSATGLSLTGANSSQTNKSIVPYAIGDTSATGTGIGFVTYNINPANNTANTTGIRPLTLASEYTQDALSTGNNIRLTTGNTTNVTANTTINALLLDSGTLNFGSNTRTLTVTTGAVAETTGGMINSTTSTTRILAFGATEAKIFAVGSFNIESAITGTGGLTLGGPGTLTMDVQVKGLTGGLTINSGELQSGITSAFASQAVTVRAGGLFDLNGFSNSISTLALESGSTLGGSVTTGAGTLTLGGNVTQTVNGSGATSATIGGNLALGATRTFTTADGNALNDLSISAIISGGAGVGIIKAGAGQMGLSGANSYQGTTTSSVGTLSILNSTSLGSTSSTSVTSGAALDLAFNSATLGNTNTITLNGTGINSGGALTFSGNSITINNPISLATTSSIGGSGTGTMTLGGAITGTSVNLTANLTNAAISLPVITFTTGGNLTVTTNGAITQTGILTVPGASSFTAGANAITLTLNNLLTGNVSLSNSGANNVALTRASGALSLGTVSVGSGSLTLTGVGVSQPGGIITSSGAVTINGGAGVINLNQTNAFSGTVAVNNSGANNVTVTNGSNLNVATSSVGTGTLFLNAIGISQTGTITQAASAGGVTLTAGAGAIALGLSNAFTGALQLNNSGANNVSVTNSGLLTISSANLGTGTLTLGGAGIAQTGGIVQAASAGAVTINAGANSILLTQVNTFTGAVSLNNSGANNVSINNGNSLLTIGTSNVGSGTLTFTGGSGGITQTGAVTQAASAGTVTFSLGTGAVNFSQNNAFTGGVTVSNSSGSSNLSLTNSLLLTLVGGGWNGSGTATYTGAGIAQSGAIAINGAATFNAGANAINLSNASNSFGSTVALNNSGANNVSVTDSNGALDLATSNVGSGTLALAGNGVGQTGAIIQAAGAGTATITSNSGSNITLTNSGNIFTGSVSLNGSTGAISLTDSTPLSLATSNLGSGVITLVSGGSLTQTGVLTQAASANNFDITLSNASSDILWGTHANSLTGNINLNGTAANLRDFSLQNVSNTAIQLSGGFTSATNLRDVTIQFTNAGFMLPGITLHSGGNLSVTTAGAISSNGGITVPGTSSFTAGANSILLTNSNAFAGAVTLSNSGANNVNVSNSVTPLTIASAVVGSGTLSLSGTGITQTGAITQAVGGGAVTIAGGAGAINLTNSGNVFRGGVQLTNSGANNVDLTNSIALSMSSANVGSGTFNLTGVGVSQTGTMAQAVGAGNVTINAGAGAINLALGNNLRGAISLNNSGANNVSFNNTLSYALGTSSVGSGSLVLSVGLFSAATITQTGAITQAAGAGTVTLSASASGSDINLSTQANNFTGNITFGGTLGNIRDFGLRNTNSSAVLPTNLASLSNLRNLTLQFDNAGISFPALTLTNSGNLTVTTGGAIGQTGILTVPGTASFSAGANAINLGQNNAFTGAVTLNNTGANNATINNNIGLILGASTVGGKLTVTSAGTITLNGALAANASGDSIVLSGTRFSNSGSFALNPGVGRFLVWSSNTNPFGGGTPDDRGGLAYNFKQYNATYGVTTVLGSGNGFLYTLAPTITPSLTGTVSKSYNASTVATLAGANYATSGTVDGDTVTLNNPTTGSYDNKNVGTSKNVSVSGIAIGSAINGGATIYGYQLSSTSANANMGTITAAPITISSDAGQTKVYGNNDSASSATAYSVTAGTLFGSDVLTGNMGRAVGETVGLYNFTQNTASVSDGNSGNNYAITFNGSTNKFQITPRPLTATIANQTKVYGANDPLLSGIGVNLGNVINSNVTDINGNSTPINDTSNVSTTLASLVRAVGESVNSYNITGVTFDTLTGSSASNYTLANSFSATPTLSITPKALSGSIANQTKVYGANDPTLSGITVNLAGIVNGSITTWNGNVTENGSAVSTTLASLARQVGETVNSYNITGVTFNALSGAAAGNYSLANSFAVTPTLSITPKALSGSIANQTKVYGASDPTLSGITVNLGGIVNGTIATWNGNVSENGSAVSTTLSSLTRQVGEAVTSYNITGVAFNTLAGAAASNYTLANSFAVTPTLSITPKALSGSIANRTKVYGASDPTLSGINVNLAGVVNGSIATWNGNVTEDGSAVSATLSSLARQVGEAVNSYNITGVTFNALSGTASGNYSLANSFAVTPTLSITPKALSGSIANQTKIYGANDPTLSGITVNLGGIVNGSITTWNGNVAEDGSAVSTTLTSLARQVGESVNSYNITGVTFNTLIGSAASNYSLANSFAVTPTLSITPKALSGSIANQTKVYGANDPTLSGITVNLAGIINGSISTWNGNVTENGSAVSTTLASLARQVGESVNSYNITGVTFNTLTGSAASNYSLANSFAVTPTLAITPKALSGSIANQTKVYGANDPILSGINVNLAGIVNGSITTWNGNVNEDGSAVSTTLASLARQVGETVNSYNITGVSFNALSGAASGNYSLADSFAVTPTLSITPKALSSSIANQSKIYGANDPTLSGINVSLGGIVNGIIATWNGNVTENGSAVSTTLISLARQVGETVNLYNITGVSFNTLSGAAAGNYSLANSFAVTPTLSITPKTLSGSIANQTKVYGANDPTLSGINVNLAGIVNSSITTWNGNVTEDGSAVNATLSSLARQVGEAANSYNITGVSFNALSGAAAGNYSLANSFAVTPTLSITPKALSGSIANQTKVYGANDPTLSGINVNLAGIVNGSITTWNGNVNEDGSAVSTTLASLTRQVGETVNSYNITSVTFNSLTGSAAGNYSLANSFAVTPTLSITPKALSGSIANQTKVYGANDPTLSGINVNLAGIVNGSIATWNGNVSEDGSAVSTTLASLARQAGETVNSYNITGVTFNALSGAAAGNYSLANTFAVTPTLSITPKALSGSIANQTKIYGANDPTLSGITVNLGDIVNGSVATWNGNVTEDGSAVNTTLTSLARQVGEAVNSYNITGVTFNALSGAASGNYTLANSFAVTPALSITPKALSGSIANQTKIYGANDPTLSGITVNLAGIVNGSITTWNGNVSENGSGVSTMLSSLARQVGEAVNSYNITGVAFNALAGAAAGNYTLANSFAVTPTLSITPKALSGSIANQTKVYGANDPTLSGINVNLAGIINGSITTWNGAVTEDGSVVSATLANLSRQVGETVNSYNITGVSFNALSGAASGNYSLADSFAVTPTLSITPKALSGSIANQTKIYGTNDPTLSGITVNLGGIVNGSITTWNGNVTEDGSAVSTTLASLARQVGESVNSYNITGVSFNALSGTASGNYSLANSFAVTPILSITPKELSGSIANQTKVYGASDPALSGITVNLAGMVNGSITTWNGNVTEDGSAVSATLASLARQVGESVNSYNITGVTFNTLTGSVASNYSLANSFAVTPTLSITPKALSGSIANQTKVYGVNDPILSGINVNLAGIVNGSISTWNGNVIEDGSAINATLASLARQVGETVNFYNITGVTFNPLAGDAAGNYTLANTFAVTPTLSITPKALSSSIANQTKIYGANDPTLSGINVNLAGIINGSISTWNGSVTENGSAVSVTLDSLARQVGELVSSYNITGVTFNTLAGASASNYTLANTFAVTPTLSITPKALSGSIADQTKVYGANDPTLPGINVNLAGIFNGSISTWNGNVTEDGSAVSATLFSLARQVGEAVNSYNITGVTFNTLSGAAAGNYSLANSFAVTPTLAITPKALSGSIADQTKVYGTNDPTLSGINVNLTGIVNGSITTWNGNVTEDGSAVSTTLASLARQVGETVNSYNITAVTFNSLTGSDAGNYSLANSFAVTPTLSITPKTLSGSIANQTKVYGANDPTLAGINVNLAGIVNGSIATWNGNVTEDGSAVSTTLASLARQVGETVNLYDITGVAFNALSDTASGNYSLANTFAVTPTLAITPKALSGSIANQTKVYGANDPTLSGINVNLAGIVNGSITTWNGNVTEDGSAVSATLANLARQAGETVNSYNITGVMFNVLSGAVSGNYSLANSFAVTPNLSITPKALSGSIANQTKIYGANDPALSGINVNLSGIVNGSIATWNGNVTENGSAVSTTLASLARQVGESVNSYDITGVTFNPLTGSAASNYSLANSFAVTPTLSITPKALSGSIANQTKIYGANDPTLSGIHVNLAGIFNGSISTWNGNVTEDGSAVSTSLVTLARQVGETVNSYNITGVSFNALSGAAASNYSLANSFALTPTLSVTPKALSGSIANQSKIYGANDPTLSSMNVNLAGIVNGSITTWNGDVTEDGSAVSTTLASLSRQVGEAVNSYNITGVSFNALSGTASGNYSLANSFVVTPTLSITPKALSGSIANQTKVYGANDPTLSGINVNLAGIVNGSITTWNGNVTEDGSAVNATLASLARQVGETVNSYSITGVSFNALSGAAAGNYSLANSFAVTPTLSITSKALSGSIANQAKIYGANDPTLSGINVNLAGIVNGSITTWNGNVTEDGSAVSTTLASLARQVGETVNSYNITGVSFNALSGAAAGNYSLANAFAVTPTLSITPKALSGSIANQTKVYGANDPTLSGIAVNVAGIVNGSISTWNGNVTEDGSAVSTTLASLARQVGETVNFYNITGVSFNTLSGAAAGNYSLANSFAVTPTLSITPKALSGSIANQTKIYGANDPTLPGINVNLAGIVNSSITTWNGDVTENGSAVSATLASLARQVGETVNSYNITGVNFNALSGAAAGNYSLANSFAVMPTLSITPKALSGSIANQTKVYGANDPILSGMNVNLAGVFNGSINTWNGDVTEDGSAVSTTLASLARQVGETVNSYDITGVSFNALSGAAAGNYSLANSFAVTPTLAITPKALSASIGNQTKVYGANDPTLSGINVNLAGIVNSPITTWNGNVTEDGSAVNATLASLARQVGETVNSYNITGVSFNALNGAASGNYSLANSFTVTPTLSITPKALSGSITNQTKVYGASDPTLSAINVNLGGIVNGSITTWNGNVIEDGSAVSAALSSLARQAGETVNSYNITGVTFNSLSGAASNNYSLANSFVVTPTLAITPKVLSGSIVNQTKVYGANDPTISGITVNLGGIVNGIIATWNGNVIENGSAVSTTLSSLARQVGEAVDSYNITGVVFNALSGGAASNYSLANTFAVTPTLSVTPKALSGSIANQTKVYGANDPNLSGINVNLVGIFNGTINTWNGDVTEDGGAVSTTLSNLTRQAGEAVNSYNITSVTFNALSGAAAGNYSLANSFALTPTLSITPKALSGAIANQTKVYGANDPTLSSINVNLAGIVNGSITTWNGNVTEDGSAVSTTLASLMRQVGETVNSYNITGVTFNALSGTAAGNYSLANSFAVTPTLSITPKALSGAIANQTKVYGANDPLLSSINVNLAGTVNGSITTWNGNVTEDGSAVNTTLASLARQAGETVNSYNINGVSFNALSGAAAGNYSLANSFAVTPTLSITPKALSGSIANQTKVYGANDPTLSGIAVNLAGIVNGSISTWNGNVTEDGSAVSTTLASLARQVGETVNAYNITTVTFNSLTGSDAGNYSLANSFAVTPTLSITPKALSGSISNQTKVYGANDPTLSGVNVNLSGVVNGSIGTWNGNVIENGSAVSTTLASLTRQVGEAVNSYNITGVVFDSLTGSAAHNYTLANTFALMPTLSITPKVLSGAIANQTKIYGANDPTLSGINVNLAGIINGSITTWNGNVTEDGSAVSATLANLARQAGETVNSYNITGVSFNALSGTAAGNYSLANTFAVTPTLSITPKALSGSIANQTKVYGANDPTLSGIAVNLAGIVNGSISTWNGNVTEDGSAVSTTLASLARQVGETVNSYNITDVSFNALSGAVSDNYSLANSFVVTPTLSITPKALSSSIANQTKIYGANDPTLSSINVNLSGIVNGTIATWNGNVIEDGSAVSTTLASLARQVGETVNSYNITGVTFNALSGAASSNYSLANSFAVTPTLSITPASLTGTIVDQTKVYGQNDPSLSSINVALSGLINNPDIVTWNGNVSINDSSLTSQVLSLTRAIGENVGVYGINSGTFSVASSNYAAPIFIGTPALTITQASLTGSIADQSKMYGSNDPALSSIGVILTGLVVNPAVSTWNGNVAINDSSLTASVSALARAGGESVGTKAITAITLSSNFSNYSAPSVTGAPILTITPANLTGTIANQSKVYGQGDPSLASIPVTLFGIINNPAIMTWNGNVAVNDVGNVNATLSSLTRVPGETVNSGPYAYTSGTFNSLTGSSASNYTLSNTLTGSPTLTITPAMLTAALVGSVSKTYDTTTIAALTSGNYQLNGIVGSDSVTLNEPTTGAYNNPNAGAGKNISVSGLVISGISASNYQLISDSINANIGIINPASLSVTANSVSKYANTPDPALTYTTVGIIGGVPVSQILGGDLVRTAGQAPGQYSISMGSLASISGNYNISNFVPATFTILPDPTPVPSGSIFNIPFVQQAFTNIVTISLPNVTAVTPNSLGEETPLTTNSPSSGAITLFTPTSSTSETHAGANGGSCISVMPGVEVCNK